MPREAYIEFDTGAQSPLSFSLSDTDIRREPWPEGYRLSVVQDESDTFYGSNLKRENVKRLSDWLQDLLNNWDE